MRATSNLSSISTQEWQTKTQETKSRETRQRNAYATGYKGHTESSRIKERLNSQHESKRRRKVSIDVPTNNDRSDWMPRTYSSLKNPVGYEVREANLDAAASYLPFRLSSAPDAEGCVKTDRR